jgi:glycosyltransferase involved in cell wall biosynthesis
MIWRFLLYHFSRVKRLWKKLETLGYRLSAIEVSSQELSYGFPEIKVVNNGFEHICCFPGESYQQLRANEVHKKLLALLIEIQPDVVFAPATAFPEGMAAYAYRLASKTRAVMMDDAWEYTDQKGMITKEIKRLIHRNIDAVLIPASSHLPYFLKMGFPEDRIIFGVDVVDNDFFSRTAEKARINEVNQRKSRQLPYNYFLFVGRFLGRKGIETLIKAYTNYHRATNGNPWDLILVGGGDYLNQIKQLARDIPGICFVGPQFEDNLCDYYALARVLIVPSISDPWGLVVNEGMASGLPVVVSNGCGAAKTLVQEGENGWTFEPEDGETLTKMMTRASSLSSDALKEMGRVSQSIISEWSLDRFAAGVLKSIEIPRRPPAGLVLIFLPDFGREG